MAGEVWTGEWPAEPGWYWVALAGGEVLQPADLRALKHGRVAVIDGFCWFDNGAAPAKLLWGPRIEKPEGPARTPSLA